MFCTNESTWEEYSVELNVVFAHELVLLDLLVLPPITPVVGLISCDRDLAYRRVEPNLKHLRFEPFYRNGSTPLKITGYAAFFQPNFEQCLCQFNTIIWPFAVFHYIFHLFFQLVLNLGQLNENVVCILLFRSAIT